MRDDFAVERLEDNAGSIRVTRKRRESRTTDAELWIDLTSRSESHQSRLSQAANLDHPNDDDPTIRLHGDTTALIPTFTEITGHHAVTAETGVQNAVGGESTDSDGGLKVGNSRHHDPAVILLAALFESSYHGATRVQAI